MISFDPSVCQDLLAARTREWLETNGLGGFASSTIVGMNTRRYHGLLVAATHPPLGRVVMLSKLEETVQLGNEAEGGVFELGCNQYPGAIHPQGHVLLSCFQLSPFPTFVYDLGVSALEKQVFMVHGENTTVLRYRLLGQVRWVTLELRPLVAFRDYHCTAHENDALSRNVEAGDGWVKLQPYEGLPPLYLHAPGDFIADGLWYRNFEYFVEQERGLDFREDLFSHGVFRCELRADQPLWVLASTENCSGRDPEALREDELIRREGLTRRSSLPLAAKRKSSPFVDTLIQAADQFIVKRGDDLKTVIAGYHWFGDWGRDTMIALPGLTLATGRFQEAKQILRAFAAHCDRGMLPNRFPDSGETPDYNTADATLWFCVAIHEYVKAAGDLPFVRDELWPTLKEILRHHRIGTRYGIGMDEDGLIVAGEPGTQLTWMDAKVGDWVVTPRIGKPVEIQALWYNALKIAARFAKQLGETDFARECEALASKVKRSFNAMFWDEERGCLFDCVNGDQRDPAMRPNQVFAASLPYLLLSKERARRMLSAVRTELLTPFGLRSLSSGDPQYVGVYIGDQWRRDGAYHQGTVWAWLIGPFVTAWARVFGEPARREVQGFLAAFASHLNDAGLGSISEIFDGDPPHTPRGCIAQAWSVAEVLRVTCALRLS